MVQIHGALLAVDSKTEFHCCIAVNSELQYSTVLLVIFVYLHCYKISGWLHYITWHLQFNSWMNVLWQFYYQHSLC